MRLTASGSWPGELVIRQGWARAESRPWNEDLPEASLRLVRGGARFLHDATVWILQHHAPAVLSPPLSSSSIRTWRKAGFQDHLELDLFRRAILGPVEMPPRFVTRPRHLPWEEANALDRASFHPLWRLGELGLREAFAAVPRSVFFAVNEEGRLAGFAITGIGAGLGYLQRLAVHPDFRRRGIGRALVRASFHFVHSHSGGSILLNTQPDNLAAARLYESEGFVRDGRPLLVLRSAGNVTP